MNFDFDHTLDHRKNGSYRWGMEGMPDDVLGMGQFVDGAAGQLCQVVGQADLGVEQHALAFQLIQLGHE